jgi:excisionase family DNA binding protein
MPGNWMSLGAAAELLGVHPSTVRNWADQGVLPVHRTQGGHRRFLKKEIELWVESQRMNKNEDSNHMFRNALGYARIQIIEGQIEQESWYHKLDKNARNAYRRSGRTLMQGLMKSQGEGDETAKKEARAIGSDYGSIGRRYGLSISEGIQAFLFFRNVLLDAAFHVFEQAVIKSPYAWSDMLKKINSFTDYILIALVETYEERDRGVKNNK